MDSSSERGGNVKLHEGFEYLQRKDRRGPTGILTWRCREYRKFHCLGSIKTLNGQVVQGGNPNHTHMADPVLANVRKIQSGLRTVASSGNNTTRSVLGEILNNLDDDEMARLPKRTSLEDNIRSKRRVTDSGNPNPVSLNFAIPIQFSSQILHDSGMDDPSRILVMGSMDMVQELENSDLWLGDGTFAIVPNMFYQLYTLHCKVGNKYPPCIYFLLPNKTQGTYEKMLGILNTIIPNSNPSTILIDFEVAAQNAFMIAFPNSQIKGCLFHLSQSVMRHVCELGLKREFETNKDFNMSVKSLAALTFVPEEDILEVFQELANYISDTFPELQRCDDLLSYFETTYIQGRDRGQGRGRNPARFPPQLWTHVQNIEQNVPRTTNAVEGYHNGLNSLFLSQHPSIWKLISGLERDINIQRKVRMDNLVANNPPSSQRYVHLAMRLATKVANYENEQDKLSYLRAVAHIFSG